MNVDIVVSIRASVDTAMLSHIFESVKNATPVDGILSFEVDGTNVEPSRSDPDWYDNHCPTCDAPVPFHTVECAVPFRPEVVTHEEWCHTVIGCTALNHCTCNDEIRRQP